ncbi:MAG: ATP-binding protein, partial [Anaerolineae bacterium]
PLIQRLLGLPLKPQDQQIREQLDPERLSQLTRLAIREWLLNESTHGRLMVVLDDFHWADDLSREALEFLIGLVTEAQIFFCVISRPEPGQLLNQEQLANELCETIELSPLTRSESHTLLGNLVSLEGFPEATIETILTRAQGNPFYIEEFVRMLIEKEMLQPVEGQWRIVSSRAVGDLEFPTSLRGLMLARVDRLPENLRYLVQDAAVIGLQFDQDLLQAIERRLRGNDDILPMVERLIDLDLWEARPQVGAGTYAFRHILTQETVYRSILRHERPELHRVVAECIERLHGHDLDPYAEILALHYDRARVRDKALAYALRAGARAQRRFANREAVDYYNRALQLSQHVRNPDDARWAAHVGLGDVHQHIGEYEEAIANYRIALRERGARSPAARAEVMLKIGRAWDKLGDIEKAKEWLRSAASEIVLDQQRTPSIEAEIQSALGWLTLREGDLLRAQALLERALALVDGTQSYNALSSILNRLGAIYFSQGNWEEATAVVQRSLDIREQLGDPLGVARSSNNLGILKRDSGDWAGALQTYQRSLRALQTIGDAEGIAIAHTNIANVYTDLGDWDEAEANLDQAYEIARRIANPYEKAQANTNFARLYLLKGELDDAERHIEAALSQYAHVGVTTNPNIIDAYWLRALLHLEQGNIESAVVCSSRNYELLKEGTGEETGESPEWGRYYQLTGRLALAQGRAEEAIEDLSHAKVVFEANHSHAEVARSAYWCAQALLRADRPDLAREELGQARSIFQRLGARADLEKVTRFQKGLEKATR